MTSKGGERAKLEVLKVALAGKLWAFMGKLHDFPISEQVFVGEPQQRVGTGTVLHRAYL